MARICIACGKGSMSGRTYKRRGMARRKGGAGRKIVGKTLRRFAPNLQRVKIIIDRTKKTAFVCTKCIKGEKITKA